jgi:hypothetical protein
LIILMIPELIILSSRLLAYPRVKFLTKDQGKGIDPVVGTSPLKMHVACQKRNPPCEDEYGKYGIMIQN